MSVTSLGLLEAIEEFATKDDVGIESRWVAAFADPFVLLEDPTGGKTRWSGYPRATDGAVGDAPRFRMDARSWPTLVDDGTLGQSAPPPAPLPAMSRSQLYDNARTPFMDAVHGTPPRDPSAAPFDWTLLAGQLLTSDDAASGWKSASVSSSRFARTFLRDLTIALLGFKNGKAIPGYQESAHVEFEEGRRPGNRYTRADVDAARCVFESILHTKGIR